MNIRLAVAVTIGAASLACFHALSSRAVLAQAVKSQWDGIYTEEQARRGDGLYQEHCAACHGPEMGGGDTAPALVGGEFAANWNDLSVGDLFERIRLFMPQNNPGSLSRQQNADILAYMLRKGDYPTAATELPTQTETLNQYKFLAARPAQ
jgi:mono/diheme cytochrome c family protein